VSPCIIAANNYYYHRGGSEAIFFAETAQLESRGWRVVPFSMQHAQNLPSEWSEYFIRELEFGELQSISSKLRAAPKFVYSFEAKKKIERLIERVNPDLCHLHNIYHHLSPSILSAIKSAGIPSVMTLHDLKIACPAYTMLARDGVCECCKGGRYSNLLKNRCINGSLLQSGLVYLEAHLHTALRSYSSNVDRFIVPSRFYRDKLIEWGVDEDKLVYLPNAIDVSSYSPNYQPENYFVYVGRLSQEKGISLLIQSSADVGVPLKVVGTGPLEHALKEQASKLGAAVEFTGYLKGAELRKAIANAKCTVLPSMWYENAPISVLESYALGTPVLGANIDGIPELIEQGATGELFSPGDATDLARKLNTLDNMSCHESVQLRQQSRAFVEQNFDTSLHAQRLLALYSDLGVG